LGGRLISIYLSVNLSIFNNLAVTLFKYDEGQNQRSIVIVIIAKIAFGMHFMHLHSYLN